MSEAQNSGITINMIELHNFWRKRMRSSGIKPNMSMIEYYTDAKIAAPSLLDFQNYYQVRNHKL